MSTWIKQNATFSNILKVITIVFIAGGGWVIYAVGDRIDVVALFGQKTRDIVTKHIVETSDDLLTNHDLQKAVKDNTDDLDENSSDIKRMNNLQIQLISNQNTLVANDTKNADTFKQMAEDIGKIKGKLDIE